MSTEEGARSTRLRTPLIDALRAVAALIIAWHHFALYGPLADWAQPVAGEMLYFLKHHGRATQIFFVVGGYVLARSLSRRTWSFRRVVRFVVQRYLRLGLPYLGAVVLAMGAGAIARGWLPPRVVGDPPTWPQFLANVVFLQNILGFESLSAGLWFVCINFQLSLVYVAMLWLRDSRPHAPRGEVAARSVKNTVAGTESDPSVGVQASACSLKAGLQQPPVPHSPGTESNPYASPEPFEKHCTQHDGSLSFGTIFTALLGWGMAAAALFFYNLDDRWDMWFIYFFGHFYLGVIVHEALSKPRREWMFWLYVLMVAAALAVSWRWRLVTTLSSGLVLFAGAKLGFMESWPKSRVIGYLGRTSYSLFLVHFPVLLVVATVWTRLDWRTPWAAVAGLGVAYLLSLAVADVFYRAIESPAARLSREMS